MSRSTEQQLLLQSTLPNLIIGVVGELLLTVGLALWRQQWSFESMDSFQLCLLRDHIKISHGHFWQKPLCREESGSPAQPKWLMVLICKLRFVDLQTKDFILTCSTAIPDLPRKTKHQGFVQHPQVEDST